MEITGTQNTYVSPHSRLSPESLSKPGAISHMIFANPPKEGAQDTWAQDGYTLVGTATITVTLMDRAAMVASKIDALKSEMSKTRADATAKCTRIEGQIQQLLCIENGTAPVEAPTFADDDLIPF